MHDLLRSVFTSLTAERASAADLLAMDRGHWVRDVVLGEDACRAHVGHNPQNLAVVRNVGLSMLRMAGVQAILATLREYATKPYELSKFLRIMKN